MSMIEDAVKAYLIGKGLSANDASILARDTRVQDAATAIYQGNTASLPPALRNFNEASVKDFQQRAATAGVSAPSLFLNQVFGDQLPLGTGIAAPSVPARNPTALSSAPTGAPTGSSIGQPIDQTQFGWLYSSPNISQNTFSTIAADWMPRLQNDLGLTQTQAAAIVGNAGAETGGFQYQQEINPVAGRGGFGAMQWTGVRRVALEAFAKELGTSPSDMETQYQFLVHELNTTESSALEQLKATTTAKDASRVFEKSFLRPGVPHMSSSLQYTNLALDNVALGTPETVTSLPPGAQGVAPITDATGGTATPAATPATAAQLNAIASVGAVPPVPSASAVANMAGPNVTASVGAAPPTPSATGAVNIPPQVIVNPSVPIGLGVGRPPGGLTTPAIPPLPSRNPIGSAMAPVGLGVGRPPGGLVPPPLSLPTRQIGGAIAPGISGATQFGSTSVQPSIGGPSVPGVSGVATPTIPNISAQVGPPPMPLGISGRLAPSVPSSLAGLVGRTPLPPQMSRMPTPVSPPISVSGAMGGIRPTPPMIGTAQIPPRVPGISSLQSPTSMAPFQGGLGLSPMQAALSPQVTSALGSAFRPPSLGISGLANLSSGIGATGGVLPSPASLGISGMASFNPGISATAGVLPPPAPIGISGKANFTPPGMPTQPLPSAGFSTVNAPTNMAPLQGGLGLSPMTAAMAPSVAPSPLASGLPFGYSMTPGGTPSYLGRTSAATNAAFGIPPTPSMVKQSEAASKSAIANVLVGQLDAAMHAQEMIQHGTPLYGMARNTMIRPANSWSSLVIPRGGSTPMPKRIIGGGGSMSIGGGLNIGGPNTY